MNINFENLTADDIEVRIATVKANGVSLLLYKDARCDMRILDKTVGAGGWQRDHKELKGNIYCGISIYDTDSHMWVTKWDCGAESFTEKEKGEASDSFKRAGFNWGIGRELYTSPFIWIPSSKCKIENGKCYDHFEVKSIEIKDKKITSLEIALNGVTVFSSKTPNKIEPVSELLTKAEADSLHRVLLTKYNEIQIKETLIKGYKVDSTDKLTKTQYVEILKKLNKGGISKWNLI